MSLLVCLGHMCWVTCPFSTCSHMLVHVQSSHIEECSWRNSCREPFPKSVKAHLSLAFCFHSVQLGKTGPQCSMMLPACSSYQLVFRSILPSTVQAEHHHLASCHCWIAFIPHEQSSFKAIQTGSLTTSCGNVRSYEEKYICMLCTDHLPERPLRSFWMVFNQVLPTP